MRLIDSDGAQIGVVKINEAISIAKNRALDLIEISPNAKPPVCKVGDFGKFLYEKSKKEKENKQKTKETKEIKFHPNTDDHDVDFKTKHLAQFLNNGHKVKINVVFVGRQITHKELGEKLLDRVLEKLVDISKVEKPRSYEGRQLTIILSPIKK